MRAGFEVHIIDDLSVGRRILYHEPLNFIYLIYVRQNYLIWLKIKPEFICQLAGINVISKAVANPAEDVSIAVAGTVNLLQAVKDLKNKKFLYVSSCAVYGGITFTSKRKHSY